MPGTEDARNDVGAHIWLYSSHHLPAFKVNSFTSARKLYLSLHTELWSSWTGSEGRTLLGRVYWTSQSHPLALRPTPLGWSLPSTQVATVRLLSKIHQSSLKKTLLFKMSFKWRLCWGCLDHSLSREQLAARLSYLLGVWPVYLQGSMSRRAQCLN